MPRIRTIKPEIASDVKLAQVSILARYTFVLLITQADDEGLVAGSHRQLLGTLYPHDETVTPAMLLGWVEELVGIGVLRWRATQDGAPVLELTNWAKHQRVDNKSRSQLAAMLAPLAEVRGESPRVAEDRGLDLGPRTVDHGPRTGEGDQARAREAATDGEAEPDLTSAETLVAGFPAVFGPAWVDVRAFLAAKPKAKREPWVREIASLAVAHDPSDVARACRDANIAEEPIRSPLGLRAFVRTAKQERREDERRGLSERGKVNAQDAVERGHEDRRQAQWAKARATAVFQWEREHEKPAALLLDLARSHVLSTLDDAAPREGPFFEGVVRVEYERRVAEQIGFPAYEAWKPPPVPKRERTTPITDVLPRALPAA